MADAASTSYVAVAADLAADRDVMVQIWCDTLGHPERRRAKFDWYYLRNPAGAPRTLLIEHPPGGDRVGVLTLSPRQMQIDGSLHTFGMLMDYGVKAEHRTLYPAMLLQTAMRDRYLDDTGVIFGFPNERSEPVVRRLGQKVVGQMVRYARVVRSRDYLPRRWPDWLRGLAAPGVDLALALGRQGACRLRAPLRLEWLDAPDDRFDALWQAQSERSGCIGLRDRTFLAWRFASGPGHPHRFLALVHPRDGLLAYAVCAFEDRVATVRDVLCHPAHPELLPQLLGGVLREARRLGAHSMSLVGLFPQDLVRQLRNAGMVARDQHPLMAQYGRQAPASWTICDWYATDADNDA